jgi:hypothetical protein
MIWTILLAEPDPIDVVVRSVRGHSGDRESLVLLRNFFRSLDSDTGIRVFDFATKDYRRAQDTSI